MDAETYLSQLEAGNYRAEDAMGLLAATVDAINHELQAESDGEERIRRLREYVDRLGDAVRSVARAVGADGASVSVGLPLGVAAGVNWDVR